MPKLFDEIMDKPADHELALLFQREVPHMDYLYHWSHMHSYIYVETPKVACTTIKKTLQRAEVFGDCSSLPEDIHDRISSPIMRTSDDISLFSEVLVSPLTFKFCFVRNPFTRILSCYLDKFVQNSWERNRLSPELNLDGNSVPSFEAFLSAVERQPEGERDIHWSTQTFLLRSDLMKYSFIGRFEFFAEQFELVCRHLKIKRYADFGGTAHATGANQKRGEFLGPREIDLIHRIYESDFHTFGYGWSPEVV